VTGTTRGGRTATARAGRTATARGSRTATARGARTAGDDDGDVVELATPSLDCAILPGTTRSWLLAWGARVGLRPVEGRLTPADLASADEAFLSSSVAGILPVTAFDGRPIGDGRPGRWTLRARADREAMIAGEAPA
jgi:branched-subunit amino acid aminotransferase/4-amino-4-deoxychorismate lyase